MDGYFWFACVMNDEDTETVWQSFRRCFGEMELFRRSRRGPLRREFHSRRNDASAVGISSARRIARTRRLRAVLRDGNIGEAKCERQERGRRRDRFHSHWVGAAGVT